MAIPRHLRSNRMLAGFLMTFTALAVAARSAATFDCPKLSGTRPCQCSGPNVTCDGLGVGDLNFDRPSAILMESFSASHNGLREMPAQLLSNATSLKILNMSHNEIANVDRGLMMSLVSLQNLDLSHNKLKEFYLPGDVLPKLKFLNLSANELVAIRIDPRQDSALKKLRLWRNKLLDINISFGKGCCNNLTYLNLAYNQIGNNMSFLQNVPKLYYLSLESNNISELHSKAFNFCRDLKVLNLNNNSLSDLRFLNSSVYLHILDVSRNNITGIPNTGFKEHTLLNSLLLAYNEITDSSFIQNIATRIKNLNLSHNNITNIDPNHLVNKIDLTFMDVSHNEINDITFSSKAEKLETFLADNNNISKIADSLFLYNTDHSKEARITNLSLSNNFISDIKFLIYLPHISYLNLSNNVLTSVPSRSISQQLETLDLSNNRISDASFVQSAKSVRFLDLSGNNVRTFPCNTRLEFVYLEGNNVTDLKIDCPSRLRYVTIYGGTIKDKNKGILRTSKEIILEKENKTCDFESFPSIDDILRCPYATKLTDESQDSIFRTPIAFGIYCAFAVVFSLLVLFCALKWRKMNRRNSLKGMKCTCGEDKHAHVHQPLAISEIRC